MYNTNVIEHEKWSVGPVLMQYASLTDNWTNQTASPSPNQNLT